MVEGSKHTPVLLREALAALQIEKGRRYVDCTFGFGGHSLEMLRRGGLVLGLDVDDSGYRELKLDPPSLKLRRASVGSETLEIQKNLLFRKTNFVNLENVLEEVGWDNVDGILLDLGMSSFQIEESGLGFSFRTDAPLDMRFDASLSVKASDLVNGLSEKELYELIKKFGEDLNARRFARLIVSARSLRAIKTTYDLLTALGFSFTSKDRFGRHPATRVFQALRIAVNSELDNLEKVLPQAGKALKVGGRLVVISFHSLEDRLIKRFGNACNCLRAIDNTVKASQEELAENPRSGSAKMRVFEKIAVC